MNHTKRVFVCLLGLVVILSILVFPVSAHGNDSSDSAKSEEDFLLQSQRNFDRSLSILNTVATSMGVAVGLLTLVVVIVGGFGIFQIKSWHDLKKDVDEKVTIIEKLKIKAEKDAETIRNEVENIPQAISLEKPTDEVLRKLDDFSRHIETLELLGASLKPEDYINMGNDFTYKNEFESALKAYDKAIKLKPNAIVWTNKSDALFKLGRYEDSLEASEKALELKTDDAITWYNKGTALDKLGRYDEALEAYDKAIELNPDDADMWINKGVSLINLGRYEEGLELFDKAIELKPDNAYARFNRACAYSQLGDKVNALSDLKKAIELDDSFKDKAKNDEDIKTLWDDGDFKELVE